MKLFAKLKERLKNSKLTRTGRKQSRSVFRGEAGERVVENEQQLLQNVHALGSLGSDGLNRLA